MHIIFIRNNQELFSIIFNLKSEIQISLVEFSFKSLNDIFLPPICYFSEFNLFVLKPKYM